MSVQTLPFLPAFMTFIGSFAAFITFMASARVVQEAGDDVDFIGRPSFFMAFIATFITFMARAVEEAGDKHLTRARSNDMEKNVLGKHTFKNIQNY